MAHSHESIRLTNAKIIERKLDASDTDIYARVMCKIDDATDLSFISFF